MNALNQLRAVLIFIALFHLAFGFGLMFSIDFQKAAIAHYGGTLDWNTTNIYFIRIIGSFAFVLGYLAWMASRDPMRHKVIIIGFIEFFILRNISRHLFADELYTALNVSQMMNVMTSVFFGLQALLLTYLLWRTSRKGSNVNRE
ncbi:hypothetical protein [Desulfopila aestuarii]|uniref:Uncharacterized protein n=1 Tax=Desulfopila aestuarii DSM 18488 TaxID=1121416 RepID=A0A1M7Y4U4_9BACT|nr:hypothetical protein [Desulfopila aestuarii]SHO47311.1 hypothetical protein SAMN02745220_01824 [Desulfopila aestuarii DSM 18488]